MISMTTLFSTAAAWLLIDIIRLVVFKNPQMRSLTRFEMAIVVIFTLLLAFNGWINTTP